MSQYAQKQKYRLQLRKALLLLHDKRKDNCLDHFFIFYLGPVKLSKMLKHLLSVEDAQLYFHSFNLLMC
jgi:hypothetical protein